MLGAAVGWMFVGVWVYLCAYTYAFFVDGGASTDDFHAWVRERECVRAKVSESAGEAERARGQLREGHGTSARCGEGETAYSVWQSMDSLIMVDGVFMSIFLW